MPTIANKTQRPLSVALPGGKTVRLSPGKTGQISAKAVESASLKKLVEAGEIEVVDQDDKSAGARGAAPRGRSAFYGSAANSIRRTGDR